MAAKAHTVPPPAGPALAWCEEHRPRLRKAKSRLEFKLRVQVLRALPAALALPCRAMVVGALVLALGHAPCFVWFCCLLRAADGNAHPAHASTARRSLLSWCGRGSS